MRTLLGLMRTLLGLMRSLLGLMKLFWTSWQLTGCKSINVLARPRRNLARAVSSAEGRAQVDILLSINHEYEL